MSKNQFFPSRRKSLKHVATCLFLSISATSLISASAAAASYDVVDLTTLSQGTPVVVRGPNIAGVAVGGGRLVGASGEQRGLIFENKTVRQIVGLAASDSASVFGINDSGGFVGGSNTATNLRAFVSAASGGVRELPPLAGDTGSTAYALNNLSEAVGFSSGASGEHAVIWKASGTPTALPGALAMPSSRATGINERGDVAGVMGTAAGTRAILWPGGQASRELPLLAGHATSEAQAVNGRGDVVGYSATSTRLRRAVLWSAGGATVDLGTLPGGDFSQAFGINDAGDVVGSSESSVGDRATLWTSGGLQDLNSLIAPSNFVLSKAVGINNTGMIVAIGHDLVAAVANAPTHDESHEMPVRVFLLTRSGASK